ncbi:hypothetical protein, partial [Staphylococcus epidermidis]|uniref:hypothetical protein n=1 Tax=Staphylococcus epidermidis TaxID=1282 RepID=UPI001C93074B
TELPVITKTNFHLHHLHNSQISLIPTTPSFTHPISPLLTPQDAQETLLSPYHLTHNQLQPYKQHILNHKMLLVPNTHPSSHHQLQDNNPPYKQLDITHYAAHSQPPKP